MENSEKEPARKTGKTEKDESLRVYEVSFLISPAIEETKISGIMDDIKKAGPISEGAVISEESPKIRQLAYTMIKSENGKNTRFETAYFGWVKFETQHASISDLKKFMESRPEIIRFLIVKTVRENTLSSGRIFTPRQQAVKPTTTWTPGATTETPTAPISSEELDKTIEELVIN